MWGAGNRSAARTTVHTLTSETRHLHIIMHKLGQGLAGWGYTESDSRFRELESYVRRRPHKEERFYKHGMHAPVPPRAYQR